MIAVIIEFHLLLLLVIGAALWGFVAGATLLKGWRHTDEGRN